jgi:beta-barrel assembly-enhancing protease
MRALIPRLVPLLLAPPVLTGCGPGGPNIFTIEDDIQLGMDLRDQIQASPEEFPTLSPDEFPEAYAYVHAIRDRLLASDDIRYRDEFPWELRIIDDDETLNAFAAPGGYMWVYTGLIRFLDQEDHLAGIIGHEIAHADLRHSTQQLTQRYGVATLISLVLGQDPGLLAEIAAGLVSLSFSRSDETQADAFSVRYLCDTDYAADGTAEFFRRLESAPVPEFLSTHPSPDNRVDAIESFAVEQGCSLEPDPNADYGALLDALPPPSGG